MATYEEAWTKGGDALSKKYGGDKSKFIAAAKAYNQKKYGTTEPTKAGFDTATGKKKATETANNTRIQSVVNKTKLNPAHIGWDEVATAKGGAGALPTHGAMGHKDSGSNLIINESKPGGGSRATIYKAGTKTAEGPMGEGSKVRSSSSDPNTEYGKYKKSMESSGKETHGGLSAKAGNKHLRTGMGYTEESGGKEKVYNKEGKKVAVTKRTKDSAKMRLTRAGRKDEDTTLTKTKKSGVRKVKGAPKTKPDSARTVAKKALGAGTKNPDGSAKEVKGSAIRKKTREVRSQRRNIKNKKY